MLLSCTDPIHVGLIRLGESDRIGVGLSLNDKLERSGTSITVFALVSEHARASNFSLLV